jgi:hypothetical protein
MKIHWTKSVDKAESKKSTLEFNIFTSFTDFSKNTQSGGQKPKTCKKQV